MFHKKFSKLSFITFILSLVFLSNIATAQAAIQDGLVDIIKILNIPQSSVSTVSGAVVPGASILTSALSISNHPDFIWWPIGHDRNFGGNNEVNTGQSFGIDRVQAFYAKVYYNLTVNFQLQ